jgi:hypothetical protein
MTPAKKRHSFRKMNFAYAFEHAYVSPIHATMARQFTKATSQVQGR